VGFNRKIRRGEFVTIVTRQLHSLRTVTSGQ
jgi:hypothetical protein